MRRNGWRYDALSEMGSAAAKICAAVFCREVLIKSGWPFATPLLLTGAHMTDREELRRLIDVIEKASASVQLDQAIEDIKTFANTTSFLANKLETRLKGGDVKAKKQPKSRIGKAIAAPPVPKAECAKPTTGCARRCKWWHALSPINCNITGGLRQAQAARRAGTNIRQLSIVVSHSVCARAVAVTTLGLRVSVASN